MQFDREQFKQLVLYISWRTADREDFDRIKLAKVLFYSDLSVFAETGKPLTGAEYQHYQHGPFPPVLYSVEDEIHNNSLGVVERLLPEPEQPPGPVRKIYPNEEPPIPEHAYTVNKYIDKIAETHVWDVSTGSHQHPGWNLTGDRETIPYHVALISRRKPTAKDFKRVQELAAKHEWT